MILLTMKLIASSCEIKAMCLGTWLTIYQVKMLIECYVQMPCTEVENGHYPTQLICSVIGLVVLWIM